METTTASALDRIANLEDGAGTGSADRRGMDNAVAEKLGDLERQIAQMKEAEAKATTAVVGGLRDFDGPEAAKVWLKSKIVDNGAAAPTEMYHKGGFSGVLFLKFSSEDARDHAIKLIRGGRWQHEASQRYLGAAGLAHRRTGGGVFPFRL